MNTEKKKKKFVMPHTYVILGIFILFGFLLTFILPSGQYERYTNDEGVTIRISILPNYRQRLSRYFRSILGCAQGHDQYVIDYFHDFHRCRCFPGHHRHWRIGQRCRTNCSCFERKRDLGHSFASFHLFHRRRHFWYVPRRPSLCSSMYYAGSFTGLRCTSRNEYGTGRCTGWIPIRLDESV